MTQKQILNQIRKWLKVKKNSREKLAKKLGYKSKSTIANWFSRGRVPIHRFNDIKKALKGGKN